MKIGGEPGRTLWDSGSFVLYYCMNTKHRLACVISVY